MKKQKHPVGYATFKGMVSTIFFILFMSEAAYSNAPKALIARERDSYIQKMNANISMREDLENYYYQLSFFGPNKEDIVVSVQNGLLTFAVESTQKNEMNAPVSSFHYSVPVPEYEGSKELDVTRQDRKIIVRLSKKKSN